MSVADDLSRLAAGYASVDDKVVALSKTMYSYDGPVITDPSRFATVGTVIVSRSPPAVAEMSQPFQAIA